MIESVSSEIEIVEVTETDVVQQNPSINKGRRQPPSLIPISPSVQQPKVKKEEFDGSSTKEKAKTLVQKRTETEESGLKPKRKYIRKSYPDFELSSKKLKTKSPAVITSGNKRRSQDLKISIKKNVTVFQKPKSSGEATVNVKSTVEMCSTTSSRIPTITAMCSLEPKSRPILIELSDDETDIKTKLSLTNVIQVKKQVFTPKMKNNTKLASPPPTQTPPCVSRSNSVESRLSDLSLLSNRGVKRKRSIDSSDELRARKRHTLCLSCSETRESPFLKCKSCRAPYHSYCEPNLSKNGKCKECLNASTICFICKKSSGDLKKCSQNPCVKFYHKSCLDDWPQTKRMGNSFICPLHICHTCSSEDESQTSFSDKLQKCALCPTAYHAGDTCLAAGSESYNNVVIKCSKHLRSSNSLKHTSAPWCFICAKGGHLICCDHCPSSFHLECLKITEQPEGSFVCVDCETGRLPLYHDIVWVKLGAYRWWPAQIRKPEEIPENVQNLPHSCGEFCVQFFGTHDYYWVNRGRCFFFQEDDTACKNGYKARFQKGYEAAMVEATEAYKRCIEERQKVLQLNSLKSDKKPPPYAKIKTNRPVGNVKVYECEDPDFLTPCGCDPDLEHPCGEDSACINRLTLIECHPKVCKAGEKCENQRFTRKNYPNLLPIKTPGRGWGLRCLEDIKRGTFIIEYVGELIDIQEYHRRIEEKKKHRDDDHYFLSLDNTRIIDAGPKGNLARFMNHCCSPNCKTEKWTVNGDTRVGLFSIQDIPAGTELTFNYQFESLAGGEKKPCLCGAANCGGFIGVKVKNAKEKKPDVDKTKRTKKRKFKEKKHTEDECFRCGDGGDLVLCDVTKCPKGYHLSCLNLNKLPGGSWMCPWHHCDECGCRAARYCQRCPNSFCLKHSTESNIRLDDKNELICSDHFDQ